MGTLFRAEVYAARPETAQTAIAAAWRRVHELDDAFTDYRPESELMRFCREPAGVPVVLSEDLFSVLERASEVTQRSGGAFDVTIGPLKRLWRQSRRDAVLPSPQQLSAAQDLTGWEKLKLLPNRQAVLTREGMRLDLGGIAKGYAADAALAVLREHGLDRCLVAASGDIVAGEAPPGASGWEVGCASLMDPEGVQDKVLLRHQALSTSGDTMQAAEIDGVLYSHILDPKNGLGLTVRRMVSVIAPSGTLSDSWATALSVAGPEAIELPEEISFRFQEHSLQGEPDQVRQVRINWPDRSD